MLQHDLVYGAKERSKALDVPGDTTAIENTTCTLQLERLPGHYDRYRLAHARHAMDGAAAYLRNRGVPRDGINHVLQC